MSAPPPYPGEQKGGPPPQQPGLYPTQPQGQYPPPGPAQYGVGQPTQYGAPPQQMQGTTTVVMQQPAYPSIIRFHETPQRVSCQFCRADIVTSTTYETGTLTWVACFVIFWFCALGCCLIPFCVDSCKDVVHSCPNCNQVVGRYNRM